MSEEKDIDRLIDQADMLRGEQKQEEKENAFNKAFDQAFKTHTFRPMSWIFHPKTQGTMSDFTTCIKIDDEAAGEFLLITQPYANTKLSAGGIAIDPSEWPALRNAIDQAFEEIEKHKEDT